MHSVFTEQQLYAFVSIAVKKKKRKNEKALYSI